MYTYQTENMTLVATPVANATAILYIEFIVDGSLEPAWCGIEKAKQIANYWAEAWEQLLNDLNGSDTKLLMCSPTSNSRRKAYLKRGWVEDPNNNRDLYFIIKDEVMFNRFVAGEYNIYFEKVEEDEESFKARIAAMMARLDVVEEEEDVEEEDVEEEDVEEEESFGDSIARMLAEWGIED
jgi:hypothetical protein